MTVKFLKSFIKIRMMIILEPKRSTVKLYWVSELRWQNLYLYYCIINTVRPVNEMILFKMIIIYKGQFRMISINFIIWISWVWVSGSILSNQIFWIILDSSLLLLLWFLLKLEINSVGNFLIWRNWTICSSWISVSIYLSYVSSEI